MSITASWLVLAVIFLRFILKKAPRAIIVVMWALVGIRLLCPASPQSFFSLVPSTETVPTDIIYSDAPVINSGFAVINSAVNPVISNSLAPNAGNSANPMQIIIFVSSVVWASGIVLMLLYSLVSYLKIYVKVREAAPLDDNIWICDRIPAPFILGVFRPRIYLPSFMSERDKEYVVAHERAHLKRRDYLWKPLGFLILTVYWFNPVLWIAYILLCRDIEAACDEKVIKSMGAEVKKAYSETLINYSVPRKFIAACPVAFGETGVKGRIKAVLNYKKPAFWIIIVSVLVCAVVSVCFLTDPIGEKNELSAEEEVENREKAELDQFIESVILSLSGIDSENFGCASWDILAEEKNEDRTTLYMWALCQEYSFENYLELKASDFNPIAITYEKTDDGYKLVEYLYLPRSYDEILEKFPPDAQNAAQDSKKYSKKYDECVAKAEAHYGLSGFAEAGGDEGFYAPNITTVTADIDGDGVREICRIGRTSQYIGYVFSAWEEGAGEDDPPKIYCVFQFDDYYSLSFETDADGNVGVRGEVKINKRGEHMQKYDLETHHYYLNTSENYPATMSNFVGNTVYLSEDGTDITHVAEPKPYNVSENDKNLNY